VQEPYPERVRKWRELGTAKYMDVRPDIAESITPGGLRLWDIEGSKSFEGRGWSLWGWIWHVGDMAEMRGMALVNCRQGTTSGFADRIQFSAFDYTS